ncbi:MAG: hypothetical protein ABEH86_10050 [Haloarcula sp.]
MVDLSRAGAAADRGQVLLVTTFGIAVLFVVLALVLNASAHSQAMAAGHGNDGRDAITVSSAAADGAVGTLEYVNRYNDTDYATLRTELEGGVDDWSESADGYAARGGNRATITVTDTTNGTRIAQATASRAMTNASGVDNWTLASGVSRSRDARLNVSESALVAPASDSNTSELLAAEVFHVVVADGSDEWRLFIYRKSGDVVVRAEDTSGTLQAPCSVTAGSDGYAVVDLSNGSVEGTACPQLTAFDDVGSSSSISYHWGSNAGGTYTMTVDQTRGTVADGDYAPEGSGKPYVTEQLYDASVRITYATPRLEYVTETTVTGGDSDA